MTTASPPTSAGSEWLSVAEKGSVVGIRLTVWLATAAGRLPARWLMRVVALWYTLLHPGVRHASRDLGERLGQQRRGLHAIYRHVLCFAEAALDRLWLVQGRGDLFELTRDGHDHLERLHASGRGAILLSAHVGSTAAMAIGGHDERLRIRIVGYFKNAKMINAALYRLNPHAAAQVVHIEPGRADTVLDLKDRIDRGELLAIAADRVGLNDRTVQVEFLGQPAPFPAGPFLLAAMLQCPVYFVCGIYRAPNRYELHCEPFADRVELPRKDREAALHRAVGQYADRVAHYVRAAPDNWFNFYKFWT